MNSSPEQLLLFAGHEQLSTESHARLVGEDIPDDDLVEEPGGGAAGPAAVVPHVQVLDLPEAARRPQQQRHDRAALEPLREKGEASTQFSVAFSPNQALVFRFADDTEQRCCRPW